MHLLTSLLVALPVLLLFVDTVPAWRARRVPPRATDDAAPVDDFAVLVPIYGDIAYLENIDYLHDYGARVVLCTTTEETAAFDAALEVIASEHGFRIFRSAPEHDGATRTAKSRRVAGTIRDRVVRDALAAVDASCVVCIDADTVTEEPLDVLVGGLVHHGLDVASVRLVPTAARGLLGALQRHEYRMAMRARRVVPYVISGACHVARTSVHRDVMNRHSLFFQGNDVEVGLVADAMGYRVGHLDFVVPTSVPQSARRWLRQRVAWAGGEFRLFVVNARLARRHPWFFFYGTVLTLAFAPWRAFALAHPSRLLFVFLALYAVGVLVREWDHRDRALLVLPFYAMFSSVVMTAIAPLSYVCMAIEGRNAGIIRPGTAPRAASGRAGDVVEPVDVVDDDAGEVRRSA